MSLRADQALEVASLLRFFDNLQLDLKAAIKQDGDWYKRFMPISEMVFFTSFDLQILILCGDCLM